MQYIEGSGLDAVCRELRASESGEETSRLAAHGMTRSLWSNDFTGREPDHTNAGDEPPKATSDSGSIAPLSSRRRFYRNVAQIGVQTARALAHAHAHGVTHRDVKPANILIDTEGTAWVADFGLAQTTDHSLTKTGELLGTLRYMPPERLEGISDERGDVYSLGATLYELLVQRPAFDAENHLALLDQVKNSDPATPRAVDATIPIDLHTIVLTAMAKEPGRRYQSAEALADDLQRFLDGEPITARRAGVIDYLVKWIRKRPAAAALVILCLALTTLGGPAAVWLWESARRAQSQAIETVDQADAYEKLLRAIKAVESGEFPTAAQLLEQVRPDRRDWIWRHVNCRVDQTAEAHPNAVSASADGRRIALIPGGESRTVSVLDRVSKRTLFSHEFESTVTSAAIHGSGERLAVLLDDRIQVWDLASRALVIESGKQSGKRLVEWRHGYVLLDENKALDEGEDLSDYSIWRPDTNEVHRLDFPGETLQWSSFGADLIAMSGSVASQKHNQPHVAVVWDAHTGKRLGELLHPRYIRNVAVANEGRAFARLVDPPELQFWSAEANELTLTKKVMSAENIDLLRYSPDDQMLVATCDNSVVAFDSKTGERLRRFEPGGAWLWPGTFSPDSKQFIAFHRVWNGRTTGVLWDTATGGLKRRFEGPGQASLKGAVFSGHELVTRGGQQVWDLADPVPMQVLGDHDFLLSDLDYDPTGERLFVSSYSGRVYVYDSATGKLISDLPRVDDATVEQPRRGAYTMRVLGSKNQLVSRTGEELHVRSLSDGEAVRRLPLGAGSYRDLRHGDERYGHTLVGRMAVDPTGTLAYVGVPDAAGVTQIVVWDLDAGRKVTSWPAREQADLVLDLAVSPDGKRLAVAMVNDNTISVWNLAEQRVERRLVGHGAQVTGVAFSPDGTRLASSSKDSTVRLWDPASGAALATLGHQGAHTHALAFHPAGQLLATGDMNGVTRIWDLRFYSSPLRLTYGSVDMIRQLRFSPDGRQLVSAAHDGKLCIWRGVSNRERRAEQSANGSTSR